jgi:threonine dehydratase
MAPDADYALTPELLRAAAQHVRQRLAPTPVLLSAPLSERVGRRVFLKCETRQPTGSFKVRGALARLAALEGEDRARGVVAASAGNHALGIAWAARQLGVPALVVLPESAPRVKRVALQELLVKIRSIGASYDAAEAAAREIAVEAGATFVSPFDDPWVMAGNGGTIGLELLEQLPDMDAALVPVGGGGCAAGMGAALAGRAVVVGVNTEASPAMARSLAEGVVHRTYTPGPTIAEGLEGGVTPSSVALCRAHVARVDVVAENSLREAIRLLARSHGLVVEGSGAAAVAALLEDKRPPGAGDICAVVTGRNIDRERLRAILEG